MGHMVVGIMDCTRRTKLKQSEMVGSWIHLTREAVLMGSILVLVQIGIMVIISITLIGGVGGDTCQMISRKKNLICLIESRRNQKM